MDALTAATGLCQLWLWDAPNPGRTYLDGTDERRPVSEHFARGAGLGYAPHGYAQVLASQGYSPPELHAAGLVDERGQEVYGDRLTFPWTDMAGRTILGLGGRAVVTRRPKYVNTPEPMFSKGAATFGIHQAAAAIHLAGWAIVVEGPFDALALWEMGWTNAVATVGAKVTAHQLAAVLRLCDDVVVLLDNDEGGRRGADALATMLQRYRWPPSATVSTAILLGAKDPGSPGCTPDMVRDAVQRSLILPHI